MAKKPKAQARTPDPETKRITFTDAIIKAIVPSETDTVWHRDTKTPGLTLRTTSAGRQSFFYSWWHGDEHLNVYLGDHPELSLDLAQHVAREITERINNTSDAFDPMMFYALPTPVRIGPNDAEEVSEETLDPDGMYPVQAICGGLHKVAERALDDAMQTFNFEARIAELVADVQEAERSLAPSEGSQVAFEIDRALYHLSCFVADARDDRTKHIVVYAIHAARACERLRARTNHEPSIRTQNEGNRKKGKTRTRHLTEHQRRARKMLIELLRGAHKGGRELPSLIEAAKEIGSWRAEEVNRRNRKGKILPFGVSTVLRWLGKTKKVFSRFNREKS